MSVATLIPCPLRHVFVVVVVLLAWAPLAPLPVFTGTAGAQIPEPKCVCAHCGKPCGSGHAPGCPYADGGGDSKSSGGSGGGGLASAPIIVAPVGVVAGAFAGVVWWYREMVGRYPNQSFFSSYHQFCTMEKDPTWASGAFSFGMHVGAVPWLALYLVTGPIRAGIVGLTHLFRRPKKPPQPRPPHPDIAVHELIARNYAALDVAYAASVAVKLGRQVEADLATLDRLRTARVFQDVMADDWERANLAVRTAEATKETISQRRDRYRMLQKESQARADALR